MREGWIMKWGVLGSWFLNDYIRVNSVLWCMPSRNGVYINSYFNYRVEQQKSSVSELMIYSETDSSLHT